MRDQQPSDVDSLIVEAGSGQRQLTADELRSVLEYVARADFSPAPTERAGGRLAGIIWHGRELHGSDRLPPAEAHYLRHVVARQEWPVGTTPAQYVDSIRQVILGPQSGVLVNYMYRRYWQLTIVRRTLSLRGPEGYEWLAVEYRVDIGHWVTAFQLALEPGGLERQPQRARQRWLRAPTY